MIKRAWTALLPEFGLCCRRCCCCRCLCNRSIKENERFSMNTLICIWMTKWNYKHTQRHIRSAKCIHICDVCRTERFVVKLPMQYFETDMLIQLQNLHRLWNTFTAVNSLALSHSLSVSRDIHTTKIKLGSKDHTQIYYDFILFDIQVYFFDTISLLLTTTKP